MLREQVKIKDKSFDSAGLKKDYKSSIIEFILNGFEANATAITIIAKPYSKELNKLDTLEIFDNGDGICYETREETFGTFLISQKEKNVFFDRANKGKGRYTFENFCSAAIWTTVYEKNGHHYKYTIALAHNERDFCNYSEPQETDEPTGTKVEFSGIANLKIEDIECEDFKLEVAAFFAKYLYLYKSKHIFLNGEEIHYSLVIDDDISTSFEKDMDGHKFSINFIKWIEGSNQKSYAYYVDKKYIEKFREHTKCNNNAVRFFHSIFIESEYFDQFAITDSKEPLLSPFNDQNDATFKKLQEFVFKYAKDMLKKFIQEEVPGIVQSYIDDGFFPEFSDDPYAIAQKEDLKSVVEEVYCIQPGIFYRSKKEHKKAIIGCLNLILKTNERENIITILDSIQQLTPEEREQLATTLKKYEPKSIVRLLNTIDSRYTIIDKLKTLIFDNQKFTNERDHIQKIIEQNYWLFGEEYNLVSADERLETVLVKYLHKLDKNNVTDVTYDNPLYKSKRPDIFISGSHNIVTSSMQQQENIIVELKAPYVKLGIDIYRQIEDYMLAISKDPEFNSVYRNWKFICVCKEITDDILAKIASNKDRGKKGLADMQGNFEIYAYTWSDVFTMFELRHNHLYSKLQRQVPSAPTTTSVVPSRELANSLTSEINDLSKNAN